MVLLPTMQHKFIQLVQRECHDTALSRRDAPELCFRQALQELQIGGTGPRRLRRPLSDLRSSFDDKPSKAFREGGDSAVRQRAPSSCSRETRPATEGLMSKRNIKQRLYERGGVVCHAPWGRQRDFPSGKIQASLGYQTTRYGRHIALAVDDGSA
jgi:hypothetical protein